MSQWKLLAIKSALNCLHSSYRDGDQWGTVQRGDGGWAMWTLWANIGVTIGQIVSLENCRASVCKVSLPLVWSGNNLIDCLNSTSPCELLFFQSTPPTDFPSSADRNLILQLLKQKPWNQPGCLPSSSHLSIRHCCWLHLNMISRIQPCSPSSANILVQVSIISHLNY